MNEVAWESSKSAFERAALALRSKEITGDQFLRATDDKWRSLGQQLYRRWRKRLPDWVEAQDVAQVLRELAIEYVGKWDGRRGAIGPYVVWCARSRAQRQIHKWRAAKLSGNESKNPSRAERSMTQMFGDRADVVSTLLGATSSDPTTLLSAKELFADVLRTCRTRREVVVLRALALAGGSVQDACEIIAGSQALRVECNAFTRREVERAVRAVVHVMAIEVRYIDPNEVDLEADRNPGSGHGATVAA